MIVKLFSEETPTRGGAMPSDVEELSQKVRIQSEGRIVFLEGEDDLDSRRFWELGPLSSSKKAPTSFDDMSD